MALHEFVDPEFLKKSFERIVGRLERATGKLTYFLYSVPTETYAGPRIGYVDYIASVGSAYVTETPWGYETRFSMFREFQGMIRPLLSTLLASKEYFRTIIGPPDSSPPAQGILIHGFDGTYTRRIRTDSDGSLLVKTL